MLPNKTYHILIHVYHYHYLLTHYSYITSIDLYLSVWGCLNWKKYPKKAILLISVIIHATLPNTLQNTARSYRIDYCKITRYSSNSFQQTFENVHEFGH